MGTLFSALEIGRSGLLVSQVQLDTTGHNISNINTEGYTRQRVNTTSRTPSYQVYGAIGQGSKIDSVVRLRDSYLDGVLRQQLSDLEDISCKTSYYARLEDVFQEPTDLGFSTQLDNFFDTLNDFSSSVEEAPVREALLTETQTMAESLNGIADRLDAMRTEANEEVRNLIPDINSLAEKIANANAAIRKVEATGSSANDLRDSRDLMMDDLSKLVKVTYRERETGELEVLLGGEQLVNGSTFRTLETVSDATIDPERSDLLAVQWSDTETAAQVTGGRLYGTLMMRDYILPDYQQQMDDIAEGLINAVNSIHSQGRGLEAYDEAITATNKWPSAATALNDPAADIPFDVQNGSFNISVYDSTGAVIETVNVPVVGSGALSGQTTVNDIASAINGSSNLTAAVDADGRITITPTGGTSFAFSNDTSGALVALGFNGLLQGTKASDIALNSQLVNHPEWIASGYSTDISLTGDNAAALDLAAVRNSLIMAGDSQSIDSYYQASIVQVGIEARDNEETLAVEQAFAQDYEARREETSGVNMDEETTNLIAFERTYQGCARIIQIADRMLEVLVNLGA